MTTYAQIERAVADFTREVRPAFYGMFETTMKRLIGKLEAGGLLKTFPSDRGAEKYPFFEATPQWVEYEEGNLKVSSFSHETFEVPNRMFGRAIAIGRTTFEDMGNNPAAKNVWINRVTSLSVRGANFLHKMVADILLGTGLFASETAYDGEDLFDDDHAEGSNLVNADDGATTGVTQANLRADHNAVMDKWAAQTDPEGQDQLREETPDRLLVICDPQNLAAYAEFFRATTVPRLQDFGDEAAGAGASNVMSPAADNVIKGTDPIVGLGREVTVVGWTRMRNQNTTIYVDGSEQINPGVPPIFHQQRLAPELEIIGPGSELWIEKEQAFFKGRMRGTVAIGDYNKIIKVDKSGS